ncbi:choice-of-anchor J domain-containing protein [Flavihumibacter sp. CACIAM 22H1]|uniref:T9SS-dependent choice-of-anchor J family protein n=1 Tax=Flavihumibacter sp. CACIAM 22H1 TaxID=1812911 RepID=UPI000AF9890A|nr:choice-of-anchor J domain-containing protein [Flavihumibacter sp. CACIAM 22H1]
MFKNLLITIFLMLGLLGSPLAQKPAILSGRGTKIGSSPAIRQLHIPPGRLNTVVRDRHGLLWNRGKRKGPVVRNDPTAVQLIEDPLRFGNSNRLARPLGTNILSPEISVNQEGMSAAELTPADPTLCVGPNHIIQLVNGPSGAYFQVYNKSGNSLTEPVYLDNLTQESGYSGAGDGICLYDQYADRYIMMEFGTPAGSGDINTLIFFVSQTNDPLGAWFIYKFTDPSFFPDYPKISVWPDAWYASSRDFTLPDNLFSGVSLFAFNKEQMLNGANSVQMQRVRLNDVNKYDGIAPVNAFGQGLPDAGAPGLFAFRNDDARTSQADTDSIGLLAFSVDFSNSANSTLLHAGSVPTAPFTTTLCSDGGYFQACIQTPGNNNRLMATTSFVMDKPVYRRFATHESILVYHTVNAGPPGIAGIRWHELRKTGAAWTLYQEGTYAPDNTHRFYPSMNFNALGQIAAVYNASSSTLWPSIRVTGRNETDVLGSLPADETSVVTGSGYGTFSARWGDYNMIAPDPVADSIFWLTSMYGAQGGWKTRISAIKLAPNKNNDAKLAGIQSPLNGQIFCSAADFQPTIQLANSGMQPLTSARINWRLNNGPVQFIPFTGNLAFGQATSISLPITVSAEASYALQVFVSLPNGVPDERPFNDSLTVNFVLQPPLTGTISQGFEAAGFPPARWNILNPNTGSLSWARTTLASKTGTASAFLNIFNYNSPGDLDYLVAPSMQLNNVDSVIVRFSHAYKPYSNSPEFADTLMLMASLDCGNTFTELIWKKGGAELASTSGTTGDLNWIPANQEWTENRLSIPVSRFNSVGNVRFAFVSLNKFGQNIFLDDIQLAPFSLPARDLSVRTIIEPAATICSTSFVPTIELTNTGKTTITSFRIFLQLNEDALVARTITGLNLTSGSTYRLNYDSSFTGLVQGINRFRVFTDRPNGQPDLLTSNDTLVQRVFLFEEVPLPLLESFEQGSFPPAYWDAQSSPSGPTGWQLAAGPASTGLRSALSRNFINILNGARHDLFLPPVRTGAVDSVFLKFDLSYITSKPAGQATDTLQIWLTRNCGTDSVLLFSQWGQALQTITDPNTPGTVEFVPFSRSQWRTDSIDLTQLVAQQEPFQIIFRNINQQGNNLYLDNIQLYTLTLPPILKEKGYLVVPNPTDGQLQVRHYRELENLRRIEVVNAVGQTIWSRSYSGNAGSFIPVDIRRHAAGTYYVRLIYTNKVRSTKIIKTTR